MTWDAADDHWGPTDTYNHCAHCGRDLDRTIYACGSECVAAGYRDELDEAIRRLRADCRGLIADARRLAKETSACNPEVAALVSRYLVKHKTLHMKRDELAGELELATAKGWLL